MLCMGLLDLFCPAIVSVVNVLQTIGDTISNCVKQSGNNCGCINKNLS